MRKIREFLAGVKEGKYRGDYCRFQVRNNVLLEVSVGSFEFGTVKIRVLVDDDRIKPREGMYFRQLYRIDEEYKRIHDEISSSINSEDETAVTHSHEWSISDTNESKSLDEQGWLPGSFEYETTSVFNDTIQIRDDVTIEEAILTNRRQS